MKIKKFTFLFVSLLLGFIIGFSLFFPTKYILGSVLSKLHISYEKIEGNTFHVIAKNLENKVFKINEILIENRFFIVKVFADEFGQMSVFPLFKKASINIKNMQLTQLYKKKYIRGNVSARLEAKINSDYMIFDGNVRIKNLQVFLLRNADINVKLSKGKKDTNIKADIKSPNINGTFEGTLIFNYSNFRKSKLEGTFTGNYYGREVNLKISQNLGELRW